MKEISSIHNPLIKEILLLQEKSRARRQSQTFVIEGKRELELALAGGFKIKHVLFCFEIMDKASLSEYNAIESQISISETVYRKIAHRGSTEGILAIAINKTSSLEDLTYSNEHPLVLVAEAPEKPGNIGALLRTADAAKIDAVLIANPKTDLYNPNIIRSSVGCVFTNKVIMDSSENIIDHLQKHNISIYAASLKAAKPYHEVDYCSASAIVVGTEATGLEDQWLENSTANIIIPMQGQIDSLNVSVSAAVVIFEAKRQRKFKN